MPLYEYQCESCQHRFERIRKYADPPIEECPECGKGPVKKLFSSPAIQFKGSGWYITDYARKSGSDSGKSSNDSGKSDSGSSASSSTSSTTGDTSSTSTSKPAETSTKKD
jgi:putative FmdB family regulatory protein